MRFEVIDSREY